MRNISLGAGRRPEEGYIALDITDFGHNIVWDAEKMTLPFDDNSVDYIKAHNFFEHLSQEAAIKIMNDCNRVLKKGKVLEIKIPDGRNCVQCYKDPTHKTFWVKETFEYFTGKEDNYDYGIKRWEMVECDNIPNHMTSLKIVLRKP